MDFGFGDGDLHGKFGVEYGEGCFDEKGGGMMEYEWCGVEETAANSCCVEEDGFAGCGKNGSSMQDLLERNVPKPEVVKWLEGEDAAAALEWLVSEPSSRISQVEEGEGRGDGKGMGEIGVCVDSVDGPELPPVDQVLRNSCAVASKHSSEAIAFDPADSQLVGWLDSSVSAASDAVSASARILNEPVKIGAEDVNKVASIASSVYQVEAHSAKNDLKKLQEWRKRAEVTAEENAQLRRQLAQVRQQNRTLSAENEALRAALGSQYQQHQHQLQLMTSSSPQDRPFLFGVTHVTQEVMAQLQSAASIARPVVNSSSGKKATGSAMLCCVLLCFGLFLSPSFYRPESSEIVAYNQALSSPMPPSFRVGGGRALLSYEDQASPALLALGANQNQIEAGPNSKLSDSTPIRTPFIDRESRYSIVSAATTAQTSENAATQDEDNESSGTDIYSKYLANLKAAHVMYANEMGGQENGLVTPNGYILCGDVQSVLLVEKNGCDERGRREGCDEYVVSIVLPARALGLNVTANDGSFAELNCAVRSITQFGAPVRAPTGRVLASNQDS